ncbi:BgMsFReDn8 [Biomphalaria glabrata]
MSWLLILILLQMVQTLNCYGLCPRGWFGSVCQYQCHCQGKCSRQGDCDADACSQGWFGYKCQYQDIVSKFEVLYPKIDSELSKLSNGDDTDCIEDERINSVYVHLKATIYFTWMSITVGKPDVLEKFRVYFENDDKRFGCEKQRFKTIDNNTVRIQCEGNQLVNTVILEGEGVTSLCSVHVSSGRNFGLKQKATLTTSQGAIDEKVLADGNRETFPKGNCTPIMGSNNVPVKSWSLTLNVPVVASSFEILNKGNFTTKGSLRLVTINENSSVVLDESYDTDLKLYSNADKEPITGLNITYTKTNPSSLSISLCEVSVYGECVPGTWDIDCTKSCDSHCPDSCNEMDGSCPPGCLGYVDSPACTKKCDIGKWGSYCKKDCHDKCAFKVCQGADGLCSSGCIGYSNPPYCTEVCEEGRYGLNCMCQEGSKTTSELCPPEIPGKSTFFDPKPTSCRDVNSTEERVVVRLESGLKVMCDTKTDGGGWIVIHRRFNGTVPFYNSWDEYRNGFGDYDIGEFYLGNENLFKLTSRGRYELRIDVEFNDKKHFFTYTGFRILSEEEKYELKIENFTKIPDPLMSHNDMKFTTFDSDNDLYLDGNCALAYGGAWWFNNCHWVNLNGEWGTTAYGRGVNVFSVSGLHSSVTFAEMKMRELPS